MSKKLRVALIAVLTVSFLSATAHAIDVFTISGKVTKADGTPAGGYPVKLTNTTRAMVLDDPDSAKAVTEPDGTYAMGPSGQTVAQAGDVLLMEVSDPVTGDVVGSAELTVQESQLQNAVVLIIGVIENFDVRLKGLTAQLTPDTIKAGVDAESVVSVTVLDENGQVVTDDTVTLEVIEGGGTVASPATFENGVYKATYTPATPTLQGKVTIKVTSQTLGLSISPTLTIVPGPASEVIVDATPKKLPIPEDGGTVESQVAVTVKDSQGNLVTDETVTVTATVNGVETPVGQAAFDNQKGTYNITFSTDSTTAGVVSIKAVTANGKEGTAEIILTASAPASIVVNVTPTDEAVVKSADALTVEAIVKDKAGNPVPDEKVLFEIVSTLASPGTLSAPSAVSQADGKCQVEYTAGESAGQITIKATSEASGISGVAVITVKAGPAATVTVAIIPESGIAADGSQQAQVQVKIADEYGNNVADEAVTLSVKPDGQGTVTAAATYDAVKQAYIGTYTAPVLSLETGETATEVVIATATKSGKIGEGTVTLLAEPPKSTPVLTINGTVYYADGITPAPAGWIVQVENVRYKDNPNAYLIPLEPVQTDENGQYSVVLLALENAAQTGDVIEATVKVSAGGDMIFQDSRTLTGDDIDSAQVTWNLITNKTVDTSLFSISGTLYYADGSPAPDWKVKVANKDIPAVQGEKLTDKDGIYDFVFFSSEGIVAETNDVFEITVIHPTTGEVVFTGEYRATTKDIQGGHTDHDVTMNVVRVMRIAGTVYEGDGVTPASAGLDVLADAVTAQEKGRKPVLISTGKTDDSGAYELTLLDDNFVVAVEGDVVRLTVKSAGEIVGGAEYKLTADDLKAGVANVNILLDAIDPVAVAKADPVAAGLNQEISFDGSESTDNIGIKSYTWDFGDGTTATGVTAKHAYDAPGVKTVKLTVADFAGNTNSATIQVMVGGLILALAVVEGDGTTVLPDDLAVAVISIDGKPDLTKTVPIVGGKMDQVYSKAEADLIVAGDVLTVKIVSAKDQTKEYADPIVHTLTDADLATALLDLGMVQTYTTSTFEVTGVIKDLNGDPVVGAIVTDTVRGITAKTDANGEYKLVYSDFDTNPTDGETLNLKITVQGFSRMVSVAASLAGGVTVAPEVQLLPVTIGGLAIDSSYYTQTINDVITELGNQVAGLGMFIPLLVGQILREGFYIDPFSGQKQVVAMPLLIPTFPDGPQLLSGTAGLAMESFGNAVLPSPLGGIFDPDVIANKKTVESKIAGNKLDLYFHVPYAGVRSIEPRLVSSVTTVKPTAGIEEVVDKFNYQFQLDEEMALVMLPWWPGSDLSSEPAFSGVTLYYAQVDNSFPTADSREAPASRAEYSSIQMTPVLKNGVYTWVADTQLEPGKRCFYFYEVNLSPPVNVPLIGMKLSKFTLPDPRNLQFDDRGLITEVVDAIKVDLGAIINEEMAKYPTDFFTKVGTDAKYQAELIARITDVVQVKAQDAINNIIARMQADSDMMIVSHFAVPKAPADGSLWVAHFDISNVDDGDYELQLTLSGDAGPMDEVKGKVITLDRSAARSQSVVLEPGRDAGLYEKDGVYVASAKAEIGTIKLTATYSASDAVGTVIQVLNYAEDPTELASSVWMPINSEFIMQYVVMKHLSEELKKELEENPSIDTLMKLLDEIQSKEAEIWADLKKLDPEAITKIEKGLSPQDQAALGQVQDLVQGLLTGDFSQLANISSVFGSLQKMMGMLSFFAISPLKLGPTGVYSAEVLLPVEGKFWLRAVPFDDILNMEVSAAPIRLDVVPYEADILDIVKANIGDVNGDGDTDDKYESGDADGFIIFSDVDKVALTIKVSKLTGHPITSAMLQYAVVPADGGGMTWVDVADITDKLTSAAEGDEFDVDWDIDFDAIKSGSMKVAVRAIAVNALGAAGDNYVEMALDAGVTPSAPAVIELAYTADERNIDSGAPMGTVVITAKTRARTITDIDYVKLEISKDGGTTFEPLAEIKESTPVIDPDVIANAVEEVVAGADEAEAKPNFLEWKYDWDTTTVDDTITNKEPENRDYTQDDNPYVIRAVTIDVTGATQEIAAVEIKVSVDNVDDVAPIAGTKITKVESQDDDGNFIEVTPDGGVYTVSAMVRITATPAADPATFDKVFLLVSGVDDPIEMTDMGDGTYQVEVNSEDLPNGEYTVQALAEDASGNREEALPENASKFVIANIRNADGAEITIADVVNTMTYGKTVSRTMDVPKPIGGQTEFMAKVFYAKKAQMRVKYSDGTVETVAGVITPSADVPNLMIVTFAWDTSATAFDIVDLDFLFWASPAKVVSAKGVIVDNTAPTARFESPIYGAAVSPKPTIWMSYSDVGYAGAGVTSVAFKLDGATSEKELATPAQDQVMGDIAEPLKGDVGELTVRANEAIYNVAKTLKNGVYTATLTVTDLAGNTSVAVVKFVVGEEAPPVVMAFGPQGVVSTKNPKLYVSYTDDLSGVESVTFKVDDLSTPDDDDAEPQGKVEFAEGEDSTFASYTTGDLTDGEYKITAVITDRAGKSTTVSWLLTVELEVVPVDEADPVVLSYSPTSTVRTQRPVISVAFEDESDVTAKFTVGSLADRNGTINGKVATYTPNVDLPEGNVNVTVVLTDSNNNSTTITWDFTVDVDKDPPLILSYSPQGIIREKQPVISVSFEDESNVTATFTVGSEQDKPGTVTGKVATYTPTTGLGDGDVNVKVTLSDGAQSSTIEWNFTVETDTVAPVLVLKTPEGLIGELKPEIKASYADDKSGVDETKVVLSIDDKVQNGAKVTANDVTYTPATALQKGKHTVKLEIADKAGNGTVYGWSFEIEGNAPIITSYSPIDGEFVKGTASIVVNYADDLAGVDVDTVKVTLDGTDVTGDVKKDSSRAVYAPAAELAVGKHTVKVELEDKVGNKTDREWEFYVEEKALEVKAPKVYPNPFDATNGQAKIEFTLTQNADVSIKLFDFSMRLVRTLADNEEKQPGVVSWQWDGKTDDGEDLAKGVYFCQIIVKSGTDEPKATVLKVALYR